MNRNIDKLYNIGLGTVGIIGFLMAMSNILSIEIPYIVKIILLVVDIVAFGIWIYATIQKRTQRRK